MKAAALISSLLLSSSLVCAAHVRTLPDLDRDGIPNVSDPDIDNDGLINGTDANVDGGVATSGVLKGRFVGDRFNNDDPREKDIDGDGLLDNALNELDIDGDGLSDTDPAELDIDGDGKLDDNLAELDTDGDGSSDKLDYDDDGDGIHDRDDSDDDGDGHTDSDDDDKDGAILPVVTGPVGDGLAPLTITNLSYLLQRAGKTELVRLNFLTDTTGSEVKGLKTEGYTYTYVQSSSTVGVVTLTEEPGEYELLTLDFAAGTYTKQEFEHGRSEETKKGAFSLVTP
jgi:hypothetical protein